MCNKKFGNSFLAITAITLLTFSSTHAQKKIETPPTQIKSAADTTKPAKAPEIKIYGVQLIIFSSPDKTQISKAPVNNTGAGGFKVSQAGKYFIKATFGKKVDEGTIKELKVDIKYPDGARKTLAVTASSNGKSIESAEFEWTEPTKPLFVYLTSTQGKINTLPMSEDKKK